jgi:hypothetical protein
VKTKNPNATLTLTLVAPNSDGQNEAERKRCKTLLAMHERLNDGHEGMLKPGMLVQWKPGLKNKKTPAYGSPAVVLEALTPPFLNTQSEPYTPYFREPLGIVIGVIDEDDGELLTWHVDARRFQPYIGPGADLCVRK